VLIVLYIDHSVLNIIVHRLLKTMTKCHVWIIGNGEMGKWGLEITCFELMGFFYLRVGLVSFETPIKGF